MTGRVEKDGGASGICDHVAGVHFDRQGATIEPAFKRLNFQSDAIVVDPVSAMDAEFSVTAAPVKSDARAEVVFVGVSSAVKKWKNQRVELAGATNILY